MTIPISPRRAGPFDGNSVTTEFPFTFKVFSAADVLVTLTDPAKIDTVLVLDSDYTVTISSDPEAPGGTIKYPVSGSPLAPGYLLTLTGSLPYDQPADIQNQGGFYPSVVEDALDRLSVQTQQLKEGLDRSIKIGVSDNTPADEYRDSLLKASADAVNAASAAATSEGNAHDSEVAAGLSAGAALASQNAAHDSELAAAVSEGNAAGSASAALTSEGKAHDSEVAAGLSQAAALASQNAAHVSELAAATSEGNAADSAGAALASQNAAALSEGNAADSELASKTYLETLVQPFAFMKADYDTPCLKKTGAQTVSIKAGTVIVVAGVARLFAVDTAVAMPALTAGEDYSVWVKTDSSAVAVVDSFLAPAAAPAVGAIRIGGFHYGLVAPGTTVASGSFSTGPITGSGGPMAWAQADVDNLAGINTFSFWDLAFRCAGEQYGMAYDPWADVWAGIYFCSTAPHLNGISRYNTDVCSGTVLPFVAPSFGGDGVLKYSALRSWDANELCLDHGLRLIRYEEFVSAAFGVTEGQSLGGAASTIPATARQPGYTSRIGLEQATGHAWIIGGPINSSNGSAYVGNGRGSWYGTSGLVLLGGSRDNTSNSGSRAAHFLNALSVSNWSVSLRAAGDPQKTTGPALYQEAA